jgi:L-asparaginase II
MARADAFVAVAQTVRSGQAESTHFGAVVALDRDGAVAFAAGDPSVHIYPRSSNKPMQALAMVEIGLVLPPELLALVCASHDGSPIHREGVRQILASVGLGDAALQNTADLPLDGRSAEAILRAGGGRTSLQMNCSGKHAGMVVTSAVNGWSLESYLDPEHPVQAAITNRLPSLIEEPVAHVGVDGCGAPAHVMSLVALARATRNIAIGATGNAGDQVYAAMTTNPVMVGGDLRDVTNFMRAVPGLVAKDGAEGVFAAALPDGRAVALKIADGSTRGRPPVMVAALDALGVDVSLVAPLVRQRVMGHGREVGEVSALANLF